MSRSSPKPYQNSVNLNSNPNLLVKVIGVKCFAVLT